MAEDRGELAFEYRPIPVSPMSVALLLLAGIVTFVLAPLTSPPDLWPLGGACFLPFALLLLWTAVQRPSRTRVYERGIDVSLPTWRHVLRAKRYYPWEEIANVYPAAYEVSGAFLSPFASSAGTLVHTGIGLETVAGDRVLVRFTPGVIRAFRGESEGYTRTMEAVRRVLRARGRRLVNVVPHYTDEEVRGMQEEARKPLLGLTAIAFAFLLPPALVALVLRSLPLGAPTVALALVVALEPPLVSIYLTWQRSQRRSYLLSELSKFQESHLGP